MVRRITSYISIWSHNLVFFLFLENIFISTADRFQYEWLGAPRNRAGIVLEIKGGTPVHIALAEKRLTSEKMYRLTIGDDSNTATWIGRGKHGNFENQVSRNFCFLEETPVY